MDTTNLIPLFNQVSEKGDEFEFIFDKSQITAEKYIEIITYFTVVSKNKKIYPNIELISDNISLDVSFQQKNKNGDFTVWRITVIGIETINKIIEQLHIKNNHVIFNTLVSMNNPNITILKKTKTSEKMVLIPEYQMRARLSSEENISKTSNEKPPILTHNNMNNIFFRYKQRTSLKLTQNIQIDLTKIKAGKNINKLESYNDEYELEIEYLHNNNDKPDINNFKILMTETIKLLKLIQQSAYLIINQTKDKVLNRYKELLNPSNMETLAGRKPVSLEVVNMVDTLQSKYAVTDKLDGSRMFLIIYDKNVYFITDLLNVKYTGIELKNNKYDNTILDGEVIFLKKYNRHVFMAFDCLYNSNKDIRLEPSFRERLNQIDNVIDNCFKEDSYSNYKYGEYNGNFDLNKINQFIKNDIKNFITSINTDLNIKKEFPLIKRKYFLFTVGGSENEIFDYANIIWKEYTHNNTLNVPFVLDGLMFHPQNQSYVTVAKDTKLFDLKWKPEDKNSIDFYVKVEKNKDTNKDYILYDNSQQENLSNEIVEEDINDKNFNEPYKIFRLFNGKLVKGNEIPVLFNPDPKKDLSNAYIYLKNGEARDIIGNIIETDTVVEFAYQNDPNVQDNFRWIPLRTRYDKTESVKKYNKKYGNYTEVANKIFRSIKNPVTEKDFELLANEKTYYNALA